MTKSVILFVISYPFRSNFWGLSIRTDNLDDPHIYLHHTSDFLRIAHQWWWSSRTQSRSFLRCRRCTWWRRVGRASCKTWARGWDRWATASAARYRWTRSSCRWTSRVGSARDSFEFLHLKTLNILILKLLWNTLVLFFVRNADRVSLLPKLLQDSIKKMC